MTRPQSSRNGPLIVRLDEPDAADPSTVGPKMTRLAELRGWRTKVPEAFCISTRVFETCLKSQGLEAWLRHRESDWSEDDTNHLAQMSRQCQAAIRAVDIEPATAQLIADAYRWLCALSGEPTLPVAVRSSATGEDSADNSFAGQYDSLLNVTGPDALIDAVQTVWASLFSERALRYRRQMKRSFVTSPMAVIVMPMVSARCAGVAFSADPVTGKRDRIVIEACWGYGEAVVQGLTVPDRIMVDKEDHRILDYAIGSKEIHSQLDPQGQSIQEIETPSGLRSEACLTRDEVLGIAETVHELERRTAQPVDTEWVLSKENVPIFVQLRPVTSLRSSTDDTSASHPVRAAARWRRKPR